MVVTLAAIDAEVQIRRYEEVRKQIIAADRVIITKSDLTRFGEAFEALAPNERQEDRRQRETALHGGTSLPQSHPSVQSTSLSFDTPLDWTGCGVWLSMLLQAHGPNVLPIKSLLNVGAAGPVIMNVAQHVVHPPGHLPSWPSADHRSNLIFITREA